MESLPSLGGFFILLSESIAHDSYDESDASV
jgi:hypothetical protein